MDLLSSILSALKIEATSISRWELSSPWGVDVIDFSPGYCLTVVSGHCWVQLPGSECLQLCSGDSLLVPGGGTCQLLSEPDSVAIPLGELPWQGDDYQGLDARHQPASAQQVRWGGGGEACHLLGLAFTFQSGLSDFLLKALPDTNILHRDDAKLMPLTQQAIENLIDDDQPGYIAVAGHLAEFIIVSMLRSVILSEKGESVGWLRGLQDPHIHRALTSIHSSPQQNWSLSQLATQALLSRSAFAERFHRLVGVTPMEYVNRWRIQIAADLLIRQDSSLQQIAEDVGYQTDRAFRRVFKQVLGESPSSFRRRNSDDSLYRNPHGDPLRNK